MANVFDQFDVLASGNIFDQFDPAPAVRPGDVAARAQQIAENPANAPRPVRPVETIGSKFTTGISDLGSGLFESVVDPIKNIAPILNLLTKPGMQSLSAVLGSPIVKALIGGSEAAISPTQPAREAVSRAGETLQDALLRISPAAAAAVGAGTDVLGNALIDAATYWAGGKAAKLVKDALPLRAQQIEDVLSKGKAEAYDLRAVAEQKEARASAIREAQVQQLKEMERGITRPVREGEEAIRAASAEARTPEALGKQFKEKTFPEKLAASRAEFNEKYNALIAEGKGISTKAEPVTVQAEKTLAERGLAGTPSATKGEVAASKLKQALDVEDEAAEQIKNIPNFEQFSPATQQQILQKMGIDTNKPVPDATNLGDLVLERQRLKGAARELYQRGNYNVARQLDDLAKSTMKAISDRDADFGAKLSTIDAEYAAKHAPFFSGKAPTRQAAERSAETVLDKFIPPKGAPNRVEQAERARQLVDNPEDIKRSFLSQGVSEADKGKSFGEGFVKWWDKYADPKTDDKVLKTWLGQDYVHMKDTVQRFRIVKPKSVEKAFSDTIAELNSRAQKAGEFALKDRDSAIKQLEKDVARQVKDITGETMDPKRIKNYGMFLMIEGGVSQLVGSPTGTLRGLAGGLMVTSPNMMAKIINAPGGAQLVRRGLRALPGTTQAAAVSRQLQSLQLTGDTEDAPQ